MSLHGFFGYPETGPNSYQNVLADALIPAWKPESSAMDGN
jgi:hypothetical protein